MLKKTALIILAIAGITLSAWYFLFRKPLQAQPAAYAIPPNTVLVFRLHADFHADMQSDVFTELQALQPVNKLCESTTLFNAVTKGASDLTNDIAANGIVAAGLMSEASKIDYVFITELDGARRFEVEQMGVPVLNEPPVMHTYSFEKELIYTFQYPDTAITFTAVKIFGLLLFSTSPILVENAVLQLKNGKYLEGNNAFDILLADDSLKGKNALAIRMHEFAKYLASQVNSDLYGSVMRLGNFADYIACSITVSPEGLQFAGPVLHSEISMLGHVGNSAADNAESSILPSNAVCVNTVNTSALHHYITYRLQKTPGDNVFEKLFPYMKKSFTYGFTETLSGDYLGKLFISVPVTDAAGAMAILEQFSKNDTTVYKNYPVKQLKETEVLNAMCGFDGVKPLYYSVFDNVLLFSAGASQLHNWLDACIENRIVRKQLNAESNFSFSINPASCGPIVKAILDNNVTKGNAEISIVEKFASLTFDFTGKYTSWNGHLAYNTGHDDKIALAWKTTLDAPPVTTPAIIYNYLTKEKSIVVQDALHQMYLLSADGNIRWKKQLQSTIHGNVFAVDFYNNKKTQLLFATNNTIQLLDMNGNSVEGFAIELTSPIRNELSLFTNTEAGNYIFFVACENGNIYGFSKEGKPLPGWNPLTATGDVYKGITYTTSDSKDYFIYNNNNTIFLKSGKGENRIAPLQILNPILYNFTIAHAGVNKTLLNYDEAGNIIQLSLNGSISTLPAGNDFQSGDFCDINNDSVPDAIFITGEKLVAMSLSGERYFLSENNLQKNQYKVQKAFLHGAWHAAAYSVNERQLFVYKHDGSILQGFPLKSAGSFCIDELVPGGKQVLITSLENSIVAYSIN
jgi:hypothetical protein